MITQKLSSLIPTPPLQVEKKVSHYLKGDITLPYPHQNSTSALSRLLDVLSGDGFISICQSDSHYLPGDQKFTMEDTVCVGVLKPLTAF